MTVLGFNAEPIKAGSRCQKFSFGVYSVNKSLTLSPVVGKLIAKSTEVTATGTFQKKYRSYRYFFEKVTCNFEVTSY